MSSDMIRELFRSLENTLHERLRVIEDILNNTSSNTRSPAAELETRTSRSHDIMMEGLTRQLHELDIRMNHAELSTSRLNRLEDMLSRLAADVDKRAMARDERPVEAIEAEAEVEAAEAEAAEAEALDADLDAGEIEAGAKKVLVGAVNKLVVVTSDDEEEEEEQEEEEEVEEVEEEEEVEEVEEEVEQQVELEEFDYKGKTYYRDPDNNVYRTDDEGDLIDEVVGVWDPVKKIVRRIA